MKNVTISPWNRCLEYAALSDVGLRRPNNQDSYATILADSQADFQQRGHFFMVADGMGAHAAGELASKMATDAVALGYRKRHDQTPPEAILSAVRDANRHIHSRGQASPDFRGMGTTASTLVLLPTGAIVAHVGDSRVYRLHGTWLEQLTFDHSLVWELRAANQSPDAELPSHISKNIITRSLGPSDTVQIDLEGPFPVKTGDTFLLCSDGLSGQVKDDEIGWILGCLPPAEAAQALIDLANLRGGPDNITVVVVRVLGPQIAQNTDPDASNNALSASVQSVHPLVWTIACILFLVAVGMLTLGYHWIALLAFIGVAAALLAAMLQRYSGDHSFQLEQGRFGRGPYVTCECEANADLLARLTDIIQQLRDTAAKESQPVDWTTFDHLVAQAASASQAGNPTDTAREYLRAITHLMGQLRRPFDASSDNGRTHL